MARKKAPARRGAISKPPGRASRGTSSRAAALAVAASGTKFAAAAPTHVFTAPDTGVRGEVICVPPPQPGIPRSSREARHTHIFFLPGNPGVIEIYRRWLIETYERLPHDVRSEATFHGMGLPGFDLRGLHGNRYFSISDMCDYWRAYARSSQVTPPLDQSRVVFIGHSYGAFLSQRILNDDMALAQRAHMIMLMPALHQMSECRPHGVRLLTDGTLGRTMLVPLVGAALRSLPNNLVRTALQRFCGVKDQGAVRILGRFFDGWRENVHANGIRLAQEEMTEIRHPCDQPSSAAVGPKRSFLFWTDSDAWCSEKSVTAIREAFGDLTVERARAEDSVPHAFGLDSRHIDAVARPVASWIAAIGRDEA